MTKQTIDMDAILAPIPGDNPSGEDLRYTEVYEEIKEARRADDMLDQGDWQTDIKKSDWDKVVKVAADALKERTKDLQIGVWLTEALIKKQGFTGLAKGLKILASFLIDYWETLYPLPDEDDLEYRIGPLEFLNEKLSASVRDIPLTDPKTTSGYSWYKWQESRRSASEEGISTEDFDSAASRSSKSFTIALAEAIGASMEAFTALDEAADEKFGREAPGLSEMKKAIDECRDVAGSMLKDKGVMTAVEEDEPAAGASAHDAPDADRPAPEPAGEALQGAAVFIPSAAIQDQGDFETAVWKGAQETLRSSGLKNALLKLLNASCSASSIRQRHRYRLMTAKLALQADRPDISRPIVEELYTFINEFRLEQWESPIWIAEVIEAYYQCLTADGASDDDLSTAYSELYPKLCSKDITKALLYKKGG